MATRARTTAARRKKSTQPACEGPAWHVSLDLEAVLMHAPSAIACWEADAEGELRFLLANPAYCRAVGRPCDEILGRPVAEVYRDLLDSDRPLVDGMCRVLEEGEVLEEQSVPFHGGGERVTYWHARMGPVRDPEGRVVAGVWVGEDVTAQVLARRELEQTTRKLHETNARLMEISRQFHDQAEEAEERAAELDAIIENMNEGVVISDRQRRIVRTNRRELQLLGLRSREEMPATVQSFLRFNPRTPEGVPLKTEQLPGPRALRGEASCEMEMVIDTADRQVRHLLLTSSPVRGAGGEIMMAVTLAHDVTELRRSERDREDWVRMVSHDLRGPLTVVLGQAQLLPRITDRPAAVERSAEAIIAAARRMNAMIQDLTDIARLEMGKLEAKPERVDLPSFVETQLAASAYVQDGSRIHLETPPGLPPAMADPNWLARVLDNLLSNALKYSTPGTPVVVKLGRRGHQVACEVTDQGPGIPRQDLAHLFERYYRGRPAAGKREGLGLGLYITRLFVETMGGQVWAASEVGRGSTFGFSLPIAGEIAEAS